MNTDRLTASLLRQATYTNARIGLYLRLKEVFVDEKGAMGPFTCMSFVAGSIPLQIACGLCKIPPSVARCIVMSHASYLGQSSLGMKIAASMLAGAGGALCGNPADVIMVRMQADGTVAATQKRFVCPVS